METRGGERGQCACRVLTDYGVTQRNAELDIILNLRVTLGGVDTAGLNFDV